MFLVECHSNECYYSECYYSECYYSECYCSGCFSSRCHPDESYSSDACYASNYLCSQSSYLSIFMPNAILFNARSS